MEVTIKEKVEVKPFYMVYVMGKSSPAKTYDNSLEAIGEARRLSALEQRTAYVLKAVQGFEYCFGIGEIDVKED